MNRLLLAASIFLTIPSCGLANTEVDMAFGVDQELYSQLGRVVLERLYPLESTPDWGRADFASAVDGHGRKFVYVGFDTVQTPGANVVFEVCASSKWPGFVMAGMTNSVEEFRTIHDNKLADYPHACNESGRED